MSLLVVGDFGWLYFGAYINYVLVGILVYLFWHASASPNSIISERESTFSIFVGGIIKANHGPVNREGGRNNAVWRREEEQTGLQSGHRQAHPQKPSRPCFTATSNLSLFVTEFVLVFCSSHKTVTHTCVCISINSY